LPIFRKVSTFTEIELSNKIASIHGSGFEDADCWENLLLHHAAFCETFSFTDPSVALLECPQLSQMCDNIGHRSWNIWWIWLE
jgi:hypothetical protein